MKRIIFVLMLALAFVACKKEEANENDRYFPIFYPNAISCLDNAGMTLEIKSDRPSEFGYAVIAKDEEKNVDRSHYHYETENDRYRITQIDEYTYQLTIKPFVEKDRIVFYFFNPKNTYRPGYIVVTCGYELTGPVKEYLDNMHNLDN